jgi:hypothetical protein
MLSNFNLRRLRWAIFPSRPDNNNSQCLHSAWSAVRSMFMKDAADNVTSSLHEQSANTEWSADSLLTVTRAVTCSTRHLAKNQSCMRILSI